MDLSRTPKLARTLLPCVLWAFCCQSLPSRTPFRGLYASGGPRAATGWFYPTSVMPRTSEEAPLPETLPGLRQLPGRLWIINTLQARKRPRVAAKTAQPSGEKYLHASSVDNEGYSGLASIWCRALILPGRTSAPPIELQPASLGDSVQSVPRLTGEHCIAMNWITFLCTLVRGWLVSLFDFVDGFPHFTSLVQTLTCPLLWIKIDPRTIYQGGRYEVPMMR